MDVAIINDVEIESKEAFSATLTSYSPFVTIDAGYSSTEVTIIDDDCGFTRTETPTFM